jgi:hypothetical protein
MTETNVTFFTPYCHELSPEGTRCADDCPACLWIQKNPELPLVPSRVVSGLVSMLSKSLRAHGQGEEI